VKISRIEEVPGLPERLKQAREAAGLSQGQVSRILKMHRPAITEIELGGRKVSAGELKAFADAYKVSVEWLLGEPLTGGGKLKMAARKLGSLRDKDLDTVMRIIDSLRKEPDPNQDK
jgi:transcriptional regulator with XRE-family HTH domain